MRSRKLPAPMVPNVTKTGTSFRGAMLYYLHDKRAEDEQVRLTGERVAWTSTRNLISDDPEIAVATMRATAADQDRLKREAGIKSTGRKSDKVVYAYSLAWHPDEKDGLTRAEMERAADESLRVIGADGLQAVIVCHNDEPQPHVHVIVNRVSPDDGSMHVYSNDRLKLSQWAESYERERGKIWCQDRVANNARRQKDGDYIRSNSPTPRSLAGDYDAVRHASNDNHADQWRDAQKRRFADLSAFGQKQASRHRHEWAALSQRYQDRKAQLGKQYRGKDSAFKQAARHVKDAFKPAWRDLFKLQRAEMQGFEKREKRLLGKLENIIAAARYAKSIGEPDNRNVISRAFNLMVSAKARRAALEKLHGKQRRDLGSNQKSQIKAARAHVAEERREAYFALRKTYNSDRALLIDRQDAEKADLKRRWKTLNAERRASVSALKQQSAYRKAEKASPEAQEALDDVQVRSAFKKASRGKRMRKGRSRSRKRE